MDTALKEYEISFLVKGEGFVPRVLSVLKTHGGEIIFEGIIKKIALSYPIEGEESAYFGFCHFRAPKDKIEALEKELVMSQDVLRHLIITPPVKRKERSIQVEAKDAPAQAPPQPRASSLPLSNEELERKIDEILK